MTIVAEAGSVAPASKQLPKTDSYGAFVSKNADGTQSLSVFVRNIVCAACVQRIEKLLTKDPGVVAARVNMTTHRATIAWHPDRTDADALLNRLERAGYPAVPIYGDLRSENDIEDKRILRAMAVAGFAAANVMLLSVGVWAGSDMAETTRSLLHWVSAGIALPAVVYAGRPFFASAIKALRARSMNMDVPISLAVLLAAGMSLWQTVVGGGVQVYFDASVGLLFFLLVGRYLDRRARRKATDVGEQLLALASVPATVVGEDGSRRVLPANQIRPGMRIELRPGDQIPADGVVKSGTSDIDVSLVNGESTPQEAAAGTRVFAGTVNRSGTLIVAVSQTGDDTLLQEIVRLMEDAQQSRSAYVQLADRAAAIYAPAVHALALVAFLVWTFGLGAGFEKGLLIAIALLIVTCPCALGLAVPVVQVVASGRLFRQGILVKGGDALERLASVDTVVFDKTGTLTTATLSLANADKIDRTDLEFAARMASSSGHPLARALAGEARGAPLDVRETPGMGVEHEGPDGISRLGSRAWCGVEKMSAADSPELWLRRTDGRLERFVFEDVLRVDAVETVNVLRARGLNVEILSGDGEAAVARAAQALDVLQWSAQCTPKDKINRLAALQAEGREVLMVGDGLNDAPSLRAASVSMSPASAMYLSQTAADLVFQGEGLGAVVTALDTARTAKTLVLENFGLALIYNLIAVPLAAFGFVTPLIAAIAMSSSSLVVTLNALRFRLVGAHPS